MKISCAAMISILAIYFSACVTGDEITSYVVEPDGAIAFSIYRLNLTSDQTDEEGRKDLAEYIRELENKSGELFTNLTEANAKQVDVAVLRPASPASVLITGIIPSLDDFSAYISEADGSVICTPISKGETQGLLFELTRGSTKEEAASEPGDTSADSLEETRFALAEGSFTKAEGFLLSNDKRSALLDKESLAKQWSSPAPSIKLSLEWQIPEAPE
jgi:hypothetical protein